LKKNKIDFVKIREPGGNINSEKIRKLILNDKYNFHQITDLLLFLASRNENIVNIIKKNYDKKIILIDRFIDSTLAYQHYGMGIDKKFINYINNFLLKKIKVNFTFLHLVNNSNMKIRLSKRKKLNRYDKFKIDFYSKVQKGFLKILENRKRKYLIINSKLPIIENKKIIIKQINKII
jgi:dTMP kinase